MTQTWWGVVKGYRSLPPLPEKQSPVDALSPWVFPPAPPPPPAFHRGYWSPLRACLLQGGPLQRPCFPPRATDPGWATNETGWTSETLALETGFLKQQQQQQQLFSTPPMLQQHVRVYSLKTQGWAEEGGVVSVEAWEVPPVLVTQEPPALAPCP